MINALYSGKLLCWFMDRTVFLLLNWSRPNLSYYLLSPTTWKEVVSRWGLASSLRKPVTGQGQMASSCPRGASGWVLTNISSLKDRRVYALEHTPQGNGRVTIPESVQKTSRRGNLQYSLVGIVVFGQRLGVMIFDSDSMILLRVR